MLPVSGRPPVVATVHVPPPLPELLLVVPLLLEPVPLLELVPLLLEVFPLLLELFPPLLLPLLPPLDPPLDPPLLLLELPISVGALFAHAPNAPATIVPSAPNTKSLFATMCYLRCASGGPRQCADDSHSDRTPGIATRVRCAYADVPQQACPESGLALPEQFIVSLFRFVFRSGPVPVTSRRAPVRWRENDAHRAHLHERHRQPFRNMA